MTLPTLQKSFLALMFTMAVGAGAVFLGFLVGKHEFPPHGLLEKAEKRLVGAFRSSQRQSAKQAADPYRADIDSIFLRFRAEGVKIPVTRTGAGGGLTSFGTDVLLLTHEGRIFAATGPDAVRETQIEAPNNGFADYVVAAKEAPYQDYRHNFKTFRYNDISHYDTGSDHGLLLSYTDFDKDNTCYQTVVAQLPLGREIKLIDQVDANAEDWRIVFRTRPCLPLKKPFRAIEGHMAGGRMAVRGSTLYLGSGDYHWDGVYAPEVLAQRPEADYGKVFAIDLATGDARQVSMGNRNVQGIAVDRDGTVWTAEHGPRGGDELNRIVQGSNYGWPSETLGTQYNGLPWPLARSIGRHDSFTPPVFAWLPSVATSSLTLIEGVDASWDGDLLMGTLRDTSLYRIRIEEGRVLFAERIPIGERLRHVHQHGDGRIVLWTDNHDLIFMTRSRGSSVAQFIEQYLRTNVQGDTTAKSVEETLYACMECHSLEPGANFNAPSLARIYNAPVGSTGYQNYSAALKSLSGQRWSSENLVAFLNDPQAYAAGTLMPSASQNDPVVTMELVRLLKALSESVE
ncbi:MAG: PQQ-dependent sugar dehydrogenase [Thiocapsa sp.]|uniref:PQQ-dependent sugar dehydrogenase n=1 Tax=Thiocapsa sp. TaxID=2024551 RepID=UPI001BCEA3F9|nr:PQQ-dependent sugar dehydrogenase [Thiocapsa sp.]QVL50322.1 MAG: PQQ-dependent sugar dehydrogenase [Thiocapsa sp.]